MEQQDKQLIWPQVGEVVNVAIVEATVVEVNNWGSVRLRLDLPAQDPFVLWLPKSHKVNFARSVPAEGPPEPGEIWADQTGQEYFARIITPGGPVFLVHPSSSGASSDWEAIHRGSLGPIRRVRFAAGGLE